MGLPLGVVERLEVPPLRSAESQRVRMMTPRSNFHLVQNRVADLVSEGRSGAVRIGVRLKQGVVELLTNPDLQPPFFSRPCLGLCVGKLFRRHRVYQDTFLL